MILWNRSLFNNLVDEIVEYVAGFEVSTVGAW